MHYTCLNYSTERGIWVSADDTIGSDVGSWADVRDKMRRGWLQPTLAIYAKDTAPSPA